MSAAPTSSGAAAVQEASAWEQLARVWVVGGVFVHELPPGLQQGGQRAMPPVLTGTEFAMREHRQMRRHKAAASRTPVSAAREKPLPGMRDCGDSPLFRLPTQAILPLHVRRWHRAPTPTRGGTLREGSEC